MPVVYTGDPGVRNPFLSQGYATSDATYLTVASLRPLSGLPRQAHPNTVPAGMPMPVNVAFPAGGGQPPSTWTASSMPPAIPPARLFQLPDALRGGQPSRRYAGVRGIPDATGNGNLTPAGREHATDSGDPWINNLIANAGQPRAIERPDESADGFRRPTR